MERPEASYTSSMQKHVFGMTSARGGPGFDRKAYAPFQAIIEKGKQAKAQDEHDQYEARKARRETEIKSAARIRHAEAEANRRRAEESRLSIDDHKGKLLDEMTKNIKAILEDHYREEIREKVYEDEDTIVSAYEHDVKDQTKARLVGELESVVKAKLEAEFEPEVKQQLAVELVTLVKAELRAEYETEVKQQLIKELGPEVEAELRAKYATEVKQQLAEELQAGVKAELRAKYEEEIKNQLMTDTESTAVHKLNDIHPNDVENESQGQRNAVRIPDGESSRAISNHNDNKEGDYPDLRHHQHLVGQDCVQNGQQEAVSVQSLESSDTDEDVVNMPHGMKRSLSGEDYEEEDPYARHSKRSRSASFNSEEQQSPSGYEEGSSHLYSSYSRIQRAYQGVRCNGEEYQDFLEYKGDAGYEDAQGINGYKMDRGASGYNSSAEVKGSRENILDRGGADYNSAEDVQGMIGNFLDRGEADYDSAEDVQGTNGSLLNGEEADYNSDENAQGMDGDLLDREGADYDSAEDVQESSGYKLDGEASESYSSEENEEDEEEGEYEEEYESEEEKQYSTAPQAAPDANAGDGVITFSNTQDTAFVLSDSEDDEDKADDEDKTLVGYEGATTPNDAKHYNVPAEELHFPEA